VTLGGGGAAARRRRVQIVNKRGLHARAAAKLAKAAQGFNASITVGNGETIVTAVSIMGLMLLAAGPGSEIEIAAEGIEAEAAIAAIAALVERGFDEA
jgi:phosphocarrier protein HPr